MSAYFSVAFNFENPECGLNMVLSAVHQELPSSLEWQRVFRPIRFQTRVALPLGLAATGFCHNGIR